MTCHVTSQVRLYYQEFPERADLCKLLHQVLLNTTEHCLRALDLHQMCTSCKLKTRCDLQVNPSCLF